MKRNAPLDNIIDGVGEVRNGADERVKKMNDRNREVWPEAKFLEKEATHTHTTPETHPCDDDCKSPASLAGPQLHRERSHSRRQEISQGDCLDWHSHVEAKETPSFRRGTPSKQKMKKRLPHPARTSHEDRRRKNSDN